VAKLVLKITHNYSKEEYIILTTAMYRKGITKKS